MPGWVSAGIGAAQLGLGIASAVRGGGGSSFGKALGRFDTFQAGASPGAIRVEQTSPGLLAASFNRTPEFNALRGFARDLPGAFSDLRAQVRPAFGRITEAAVTAIRNAESRAKGTLKDQLARRRVLGSSFGSDALIRLEREFGEAEFKARSSATLAEITASAELISQEFQAVLANIESEVKEILGVAGVGTSLLNGTNAAAGVFQRAAIAEARGRGQGVASLFAQAQDLVRTFDELTSEVPQSAGSFGTGGTGTVGGI